MNNNKRFLAIGLTIGQLLVASLHAQTNSQWMKEQYRPQIHFSPQEKWMNDPNGMLFYKGTYHLFFQYYPDSTVWGPMHWAHATSKDLVHWQQQPIALYPDSLGYIFSGSAVVDRYNTSGFGRDGIVPLVAIFTHHNIEGEKAGRNNFQNQSIAYSLDEGKTWTKYAGNPVLKNPGITDFRDPKVMWYQEGKKWIMTLATKDRITFYSSKNLKDWTRESEVGSSFGAHGGVWECPDLFSMDYEGKKVWVLIANINPGGPNGGSATQYFTGNFDGKNFIPFKTDTRWIDYGKDDYAGITWHNTGTRRIFLGWMSNWQYGTVVPTKKWRSANTLPRELSLKKVGEDYYVASMPVKELNSIAGPTKLVENVQAADRDLTKNFGAFTGLAKLDITTDKAESFSVVLYNELGEKLVAGYDQASNQYYVDRTASGKVDFQKDFAGRHTAPRFSNKPSIHMTLVIDHASIELFADDGLTVMTEIFFPNRPYNHIKLQSPANMLWKKIACTSLKSIW